VITRYETPEMRAVWSNQRKLEIWQEVELVVCEVRADRGEIPRDAARIIREKAAFDETRVLEIEETVHHDVIAFLTNLAENIGPESRYVHEGMTSSDLGDTSFAVQMKESGDILRTQLIKLMDVVKAKALEHQSTPMVGRSHGIHAEPTTFGLKLLVYYAALRRGLRRLEAAIEEVNVGQISGAVGTMVHLDPEIEAETMKRLGLKVAPVATQVLQRDRHAAFLSSIALVGCTLEQMAVEIRNLQRTDVHEVEEPFAKGQKGSSAMPHKKNPIISERITGMSRLLRGYSLTAMENVALWHERDISHSSTERVIFPDACHTLHYMLNKMTWLIDGLVVFPERMLENMARVKGMVFSQTVLLALVGAGVSREDAYGMVQRCAMRVWDEDVDFQASLRADTEVIEKLGDEALDRCFDFAHHQRNIATIFERTLNAEDA
jgi:adenylosuccinate lyase